MLFTPEQLQRIREIIDRYHMALVISVFGADALPEEVRAKLREAGVPIPEGPLLLGDSYAYGQLFASLMQPTIAEESPEQVRARIERNPIPPTPHEEAAASVAANHAGQYVVGLGNRVTHAVVSAVTGEEAQLSPDDIKRVIADTTSKGIEQRESTERIKSNLGHQVQNWTRDWLRIATTEVNEAFSGGVASVIERRHGGGARVSKIPRADACEDCKRLYLDEDGNPKVFLLSDLYANGSNVGRKREDWRPVIGTTHPWCACVLVHIPDGMSWVDGELKLDKSEAPVLPALALEKAEPQRRPLRFPRLTLAKALVHGAPPKVDTKKLLRGNLGIARELMPQITQSAMPDFLTDLISKGVPVTNETVPVHELRATQAELHAGKIQDAVDSGETEHLKQPLVISADNFILDGHHRWATAATLNPGATMDCVRAHLPIYDLMEHAHGFSDVEYRKSLAKGVIPPIGDGSFGDATVVPRKPKSPSITGNIENPAPRKTRMQPSRNVGLDELLERDPDGKAERKKKRKQRAKNAKRASTSSQLLVGQASLTPRAEGDEPKTAADFVPQTLIEQREAYNDPDDIKAAAAKFKDEVEERKGKRRGIVDVMRKLPEVRR